MKRNPTPPLIWGEEKEKAVTHPTQLGSDGRINSGLDRTMEALESFQNLFIIGKQPSHWA